MSIYGSFDWWHRVVVDAAAAEEAQRVKGAAAMAAAVDAQRAASEVALALEVASARADARAEFASAADFSTAEAEISQEASTRMLHKSVSGSGADRRSRTWRSAAPSTWGAACSST